jgi:predicted alpha/beta-hydrolase family hydrolase
MAKADSNQQMNTETIRIPVMDGEQVSAVLSVPESYRDPGPVGVILAHGAGNDMHHPLLVSLSQGLAKAGYLTLRFNFLYREKGRPRPDRQKILEKTWSSVYWFLRDHPRYRPETIVAAGKSMGGRVAAQMVAESLLPVTHLIFLGYPLHPPGKSEKLRDSHFDQIETPMLFFAGTRDSLCDLAALNSVLEKLSASCELQIIQGGDHSFRLPKSADRTQEEVYEQILQKTLAWLELSSPNMSF